MKPEYINVDQIQAILDALEDLKGSVASIDKTVGVMQGDLAHVKEQTTKTNGRVDGLEDREAERDIAAAGLAGEAKMKAAIWIALKPYIFAAIGGIVTLILYYGPTILSVWRKS